MLAHQSWGQSRWRSYKMRGNDQLRWAVSCLTLRPSTWVEWPGLTGQAGARTRGQCADERPCPQAWNSSQIHRVPDALAIVTLHKSHWYLSLPQTTYHTTYHKRLCPHPTQYQGQNLSSRAEPDLQSSVPDWTEEIGTGKDSCCLHLRTLDARFLSSTLNTRTHKFRTARTDRTDR